MSTAISVATMASNRYVPRGCNELHTIFERHIADFCEQYDEKYASTYGRYRMERIQRDGERYTTCGDYLQGVARIRCTNPECGHDCFRPFSCKGFDLCPSCSRKRTIPFSGHQSMTELFRRWVIKLLVDREMLNEDFARNPLSWKLSGFSIDNSVRILDESAISPLAR